MTDKPAFVDSAPYDGDTITFAEIPGITFMFSLIESFDGEGNEIMEVSALDENFSCIADPSDGWEGAVDDVEGKTQAANRLISQAIKDIGYDPVTMKKESEGPSI